MECTNDDYTDGTELSNACMMRPISKEKEGADSDGTVGAGRGAGACVGMGAVVIDVCAGTVAVAMGGEGCDAAADALPDIDASCE